MSLLGKPIEEVIETIYNSIKSKRQIITNMKNEYNIDNNSFNDIKINRFKLIDLLDEFEVTISQSLQAIQTFKVEIFNLKEKQATEEILNLTNEFQMKYNSNENNNLNNNNNILDKLEYSKTDNSIIEPKNNNNKINEELNNINNIINNKIEKKEINKSKNINNENIRDNIKNEFNVLKEAKLNFDYSSLLNNSQSSLKTSISNLEKFKNNNKSDINVKKMKENDVINTDLEQNKNDDNQNIKIENGNMDLIDNNLNKEDIEEEQPSKLNINIIRSNNEIVNKIKLSEKINSNKDLSCFSDDRDLNNYEDNYINKFYSMRQSEVNNINSDINNNQNYNYKFNLLNNDSNNNNDNKYSNNFDESDLISLVSKNDAIKEKYQKLENDEKINKLIEEIFSIKAFKLYILDKFGNGKQNIFFKKVKNGEINKDELESELNILKEIYNSNNDISNNNNSNISLTENKKQLINKNNKFMNKTLSEINLNMNLDLENNFLKTDKNNLYKKIKHKNKKISLENENSKEECKTRNNNIKNNLRDKNKITGNNSINKNKNITSHSVSSIRAKIKYKKF